MKNIDFLPNRYYEQGAKRKSQLWRILVLLLFGGVCAASAVGQQALRKSVAKKISSVEPKHIVAQASKDHFDRLHAQLLEFSSAAELYAYLRHPWPRTQILAAVAGPMPPSLTLSQLQIDRKTESSRLAGGRRPPDRRRTEDLEKPVGASGGARHDLQKLREDFGELNAVVHVIGRTTDTVALHQYVAELSGARLFQRAELVSLESMDERRGEATSQFTLRLVVRPCYGGTSGPGPTKNDAVNASKPTRGEPRR